MRTSSLVIGAARGLLACLVGCTARSTPPAPPAPPAPAPPLLRLAGDFDPTRGWPELDLAPQVRCDGGAVLVPLERVYGGERHPVSAAVLDRAGRTVEVLDLDAVIDGFDGRDPAAVRAKLAAANAHLAAQCWRPMPVAPPATTAAWAPPVLTFTHRGAVAQRTRPDVVMTVAADDDCVPVDRVRAVLADDAAQLGLVGIQHEMHDNCGSDPWAWIVVALPATPAPSAGTTFLCDTPSQDAFDAAAEHLRSRIPPAADQPFGSCQVRLDGERLSVRRGAELLYEAKESGATWAYDPAFVVHGIRAGQDAATAATAAAAAGYPRVRCASVGAVDECTFTPAATTEACNDGVFILLRRDAGSAEPAAIHDAAGLRGRAIVAIALGMPC